MFAMLIPSLFESAYVRSDFLSTNIWISTHGSSRLVLCKTHQIQLSLRYRSSDAVHRLVFVLQCRTTDSLRWNSSLLPSKATKRKRKRSNDKETAGFSMRRKKGRNYVTRVPGFVPRVWMPRWKRDCFYFAERIGVRNRGTEKEEGKEERRGRDKVEEQHRAQGGTSRARNILACNLLSLCTNL